MSIRNISKYFFNDFNKVNIFTSLVFVYQGWLLIKAYRGILMVVKYETPLIVSPKLLVINIFF